MDLDSQNFNCTNFDFENFQRQADDDKRRIELLVSKFEDQSQRLENVMNSECELKKKNCELQYVNETMKDQLLNAQSYITDLQLKLTNSENELQCVQKELCDSQLQLKELKSEINEIKKREGRNKETFCKELDEYKYECNRLKKENGLMKEDLKCLNLQLCEANLSLKREANNYKQEQEKLSNDLGIKYRKINRLQAQYDEQCRKSNEDNYKIKKLVSTLMELRDLSIIYCKDQKCQIIKLKEENCANKEQLRQYENKFKQMYGENEILCMEINAQSNKIYERENHLKQVKLVVEQVCELKQFKSSSCPDKKCNNNKSEKAIENLCCNSCEKTNSIVEKYLVNPNVLIKDEIGTDMSDSVHTFKDITQNKFSKSSHKKVTIKE